MSLRGGYTYGYTPYEPPKLVSMVIHHGNHSSHLMAHSLSRPLGAPPQASTTVRHDPINCPDIDSGQLLQRSGMTP
ncbi:unnamed protein product [Camellia sinensis]